MSEQNQLKPGRRIETTDTQPAEQNPQQAGGKRIEGELVDGLADLSLMEQVDDVQLEQALKQKGKWSIIKLFLLSFLILILVETVYSIIDALQSSWLLAVLYSTVLGLALLSVGVFIIKEAKALRQLKRHEHHRQDGERLLNSTQIGEAASWLKPLLSSHPKQQVAEFKASIKSHHTDKEVLQLYEATLLESQDSQAKKLINQHATTSAMLVAMSPMALLDMLAVLWRGVHLIEAISQHYGIRLGYQSRISLYKMLLKQMVFAGAAELVSDLAATSLGAELLGKLSARAGQGLSAGVFTARLGYKTMALCRPLPQLQQQPNLLKSTVEQVFSTLLTRTQAKQQPK